MATFKVLGTNDDKDTCECCGKTGLKRVVWLVEVDPDGNECGSVFHAGTSCAAFKLLGNKKAASKKVVDTFATWVSKANNWLADGHSLETVLSALRAKTGLALDSKDGVVRFWSRETGEVVATTRQS